MQQVCGKSLRPSGELAATPDPRRSRTPSPRRSGRPGRSLERELPVVEELGATRNDSERPSASTGILKHSSEFAGIPRDSLDSVDEVP